MKNISSKKGFTIIEILVAVAILGLITIVVSSFQVNVIKYNKSAADSLQSAMDARSILRTMVKELRSMSIGNNGAYPLEEAAISSITFYSDIDSDGLKEKIHYFSEGTTLKKGVIIPTGSPYTYLSSDEKFQILAYSIKNSEANPLFEYFDDTYTGTSSPLSFPGGE